MILTKREFERALSRNLEGLCNYHYDLEGGKILVYVDSNFEKANSILHDALDANMATGITLEVIAMKPARPLPTPERICAVKTCAKVNDYDKPCWNCGGAP